jgi:tRNA pseudouridine38-40 synthase
VLWAKPVNADFHARFSATARRYRYIIANTASRPAVLAAGLGWQPAALNHQLMHEAAQSLLGEQDFTSFRAVACQSKTAMRNIHFIEVSRRNELVVIDIQANAFLYHMVRNIAGVLIEVGLGRKPVSWPGELLAARDRCLAAATAPARGLYLVDVCYPEAFGLPVNRPGPLFLG